ncbi:MAG TPA: hypothetical protein VGW38_07190 [Chloroflexota bacterium]|nr:hypothetical protein [Chloroflexota bacterium]
MVWSSAMFTLSRGARWIAIGTAVTPLTGGVIMVAMLTTLLSTFDLSLDLLLDDYRVSIVYHAADTYRRPKLDCVVAALQDHKRTHLID